MNASYKLIVFDLDGTLAESKAVVTPEICDLLCKLLAVKEVAIISGGAYPQFEKQLLSNLRCPQDLLAKLYILPTSGSASYRFIDGKWLQTSSHALKKEEKVKIKKAIADVLGNLSFPLPIKTYGEQVEDRGSQITFSGLGQQAPVPEKKAWDPDRSKRIEIADKVRALVPEFEVVVGGISSVDVLQPGVNKASAVNELMVSLGLGKSDVLYVGDALFPGGNDYIVTTLGISTHSVKGPVDSASIIRELIVQ